jgi:membrane associated rhomboid family serine protease
VETNVESCYRHPDQPAGIICQRCDRPICARCMNQASVGFHCPECVKQGKQKVYQGIGALQSRPIVTMALIAINLVVFVIGVVADGSDSLGGKTGRFQFDWADNAIFVGDGEWYRLVTSGFLHYGIIHIALNMYALWWLGQAVEQIGGRLRFGLVYATALLAGSLGALVLDPDHLTAGASGAIYGLMGAIFLAQRAQGVAFRNSPLLGVLILNFVFTIGFPGISIGGHVGGFVGGALSGWLLFDYGRRPGVDKRLPLALCAAAAVAFAVAAIVFSANYLSTLG